METLYVTPWGFSRVPLSDEVPDEFEDDVDLDEEIVDASVVFDRVSPNAQGPVHSSMVVPQQA